MFLIFSKFSKIFYLVLNKFSKISIISCLSKIFYLIFLETLIISYLLVFSEEMET
jgi:hypothetical protein